MITLNNFCQEIIYLLTIWILVNTLYLPFGAIQQFTKIFLLLLGHSQFMDDFPNRLRFLPGSRFQVLNRHINQRQIKFL